MLICCMLIHTATLKLLVYIRLITGMLIGSMFICMYVCICTWMSADHLLLDIVEECMIPLPF